MTTVWQILPFERGGDDGGQGRDEPPRGLSEPKGSFGRDSGPQVAVYEYALAVTGSATPRRPVPMNSTISAAAIHKRAASMKASK